MNEELRDEVALTEAERELLSGLCDVDAPRGAGHDGYCYAHHAPVKWAGRANADEVCCVAVEDYAEQLIERREREAKAEAWDECNAANHSTVCREHGTPHPDNPYRADAITNGGDTTTEETE